MSRFNTTALSALWNSELIALANDSYTAAYASSKDLYNLVLELSNRFEAMDYMVEATLDGQEREI